MRYVFATLSSDPSAIEVLYRRARAALHGLEVERSVFEAPARRALAAASSDEIHAEDLYLACACAGGDSKAIELFEHRYAEVLRRIAQRAASAGVNREDLLQQVRVRLFVGSGGAPPAIGSYVGTGPLGGWVRVVAARLATELMQREARLRPAGAEAWAQVAGTDDVELASMRAEMRESFQLALETAASAISSDDRALLRQYYVHKIGVDGIAKLLGVHRSNASRAVARARSHFLREVKRMIGEQLGLTDSSLNSAFGLMRSDFALHLGSVLQTRSS